MASPMHAIIESFSKEDADVKDDVKMACCAWCGV